MLRAQVNLASPNLVLHHARAAVPEMRFEVTYQAVSDVVFLTVEGESLERLEAALEEDDSVSAFARQAEYADRVVYKLTVDVDRSLISEVAADNGISVVDTRSEPGDTGWTFEFVCPDREALSALRTYCTEHGMAFAVERLFYLEDDHGAGAAGAYGLTETQLETLLVAHGAGYFEVPREVSQQELADRLDSSPAAVSQRLRRAVDNLIQNTVAGSRED